MMFKKKSKRVIEVGGEKIELEPKPKKGLFSFQAKKKKEAPATTQQQQPQPQPQQGAAQQQPQAREQQPKRQGATPLLEQSGFNIGTEKPETIGELTKPIEKKKGFGLFEKKAAKEQQRPEAQGPKLEIPKEFLVTPEKHGKATGMKGAKAAADQAKGGPKKITYVQKVLIKHKGLENALRQQHLKTTPEAFIKRMLFASIMMSAVAFVVIVLLFTILNLPFIEVMLFGFVIGYGVFKSTFNQFLRFPNKKSKTSGKIIERDILFAARDLIISLRSGMPLFNAITSVSNGYGEASAEFAKIVDKVQLGLPLEQAMDEVVNQTKSPSFRKILLQASVSIKAGADVVGALQSVIDQLSQERVIELRAYGQKLNAIAMFYMLFGIIMPSMGIAVVTILTTFIAIITVTFPMLEAVLVFILFLQLIFLKMIVASRPVFTM